MYCILFLFLANWGINNGKSYTVLARVAARGGLAGKCAKVVVGGLHKGGHVALSLLRYIVFLYF